MKQGDAVKAGQLLLEVDLNVVKEAGYTGYKCRFHILTYRSDDCILPKSNKRYGLFYREYQYYGS